MSTGKAPIFFSRVAQSPPAISPDYNERSIQLPALASSRFAVHEVPKEVASEGTLVETDSSPLLLAWVGDRVRRGMGSEVNLPMAVKIIV